MNINSAERVVDLAEGHSIHQELPGLAHAFDGGVMQRRLQNALLGNGDSRYQISSCKPGKAVFINGDGCTLRYDVTLSGPAHGTAKNGRREALILGNLFHSAEAAQAHLAEKLSPLAMQMQNRQDVEPFVSPIALLDDLHMTLQLFPIDPELPGLIEATDPSYMAPLLQSALANYLGCTVEVDECQITLGHYGRQHRCVLRYDLQGTEATSGKRQQLRVYGKIASDHRGMLVNRVLTLLHAQLDGFRHERFPQHFHFLAPVSLGYHINLKLLLLEAINGQPRIGDLLKAELTAAAAPSAQEANGDAPLLTLKSALSTAAQIGAWLHLSKIQIGRRRTLQDDIMVLQEECQAVRLRTPQLADLLERCLAQLTPYTLHEPLANCLSHGDFTHSQIIFDGATGGLLDFDTICQAEPALDLGHFQAYIRLAAAKAAKGNWDSVRLLANDCCQQMLHEYCYYVGADSATSAKLRLRVQLYELVSLVRIALHSWQKFKPVRLAQVLTILEEQMLSLPTVATVDEPDELDERISALADWRAYRPGEWLTRVVDPQQVRAAIERHIPEFAQGALRLAHCQVKRLRLRDQQGYWTGTYLLDVAGGPNGAVETVAVLGKLYPPTFAEPAYVAHTNAEANKGGLAAPFGAQEWRCYLPELRLEMTMQPEERTLTSLDQLTDPVMARVLLEESIRHGSPTYADIEIAACHPRIMRYKPGSRCTVLYHLDYASNGADAHQWPPLVVAKTYRGEKGENAYRAMRELWDSPLGRSSTVAIAEPLAFLPAENVLVQGPIRQQQTLKELIREVIHNTGGGDSPSQRVRLDEALCKSAVGLAEMHQSGVTYGDLVTWEDELEDVLDQRERLSVPLAEFSTMGTPLLERLQTLASRFPADPAAPAHQSFRPAQVLLYGDEIGFIDFDGFCQAEPAMDVALFMTTIKNIGLNRTNKYVDEVAIEDEDDEESDDVDASVRDERMAQLDDLCARFLNTYRAHAPISAERILLWETLDLLSLIYGSWLKLKFARLDNCVYMLERHIRQHSSLMVD